MSKIVVAQARVDTTTLHRVINNHIRTVNLKSIRLCIKLDIDLTLFLLLL